ncbi:hypothetical protein YN1HA_21110 [Sulfurisphaera ohwakuensis]
MIASNFIRAYVELTFKLTIDFEFKKIVSLSTKKIEGWSI